MNSKFFNLTVIFSAKLKNDEMNCHSTTVKDVLGPEFEKYYDGSETNLKNLEKSFFFYNVPEKFFDLVKERLNDQRPEFKYTWKPMVY